MEAFPNSHIVTFKYYVGVLHFLDEDYTEVCCMRTGIRDKANLLLPGRGTLGPCVEAMPQGRTQKQRVSGLLLVY